MKKAFDIAIGLFIIVLFLAGIVLIISAFNGKYGDTFDGLYSAFICIMGAFSLYGFSVIVDAATIYIERSQEEEKADE